MEGGRSVFIKIRGGERRRKGGKRRREGRTTCGFDSLGRERERAKREKGKKERKGGRFTYKCEFLHLWKGEGGKKRKRGTPNSVSL